MVAFAREKWHAAMPWTGNRVDLTAYSARSLRGLDHDLRRLLQVPIFLLDRPLLLLLALWMPRCLEEPELPAKNLAAEEKEDILAVCKTLRLCLPRISFKASFLKRRGQ